MNPYDYDLGVYDKIPKKKPQPRHPFAASTGDSSVRRPPSGGGDVGEQYAQAIAAYGSGATWDEKITYWGTAVYSDEYDLSEMDENAIEDSFIDEIADSIRADVDERGAGVPSNRIADVRRGVVTALRKKIVRAREWHERGGKAFTPRDTKPKPPPQHAAHVRNLIGGMGDCDLDAVRELSPCLDWIGNPPIVQTELFMRAAFHPNERLHIFRNDVPTAGIPWVNLRTAADWVERIPYETLPGDLIVPNPFTGKPGTTTAGKQSLIAQSCLASFPFLIIEFDDLPLARQFAFWRAFILTSNLAPALVALTFSGNRSIHGLVHVGCTTLADWQAVRQNMRGLFASDPDAALRADDQAMQPRTGTRLPGVQRFGNRALQELVYLNPRARPGTMWDENSPYPRPSAFGKN